MYLSCLFIDTGENPDRPRPGRLWLRNAYRVHQRLCMAFPSSEQTKEDPLFLKPFRHAGFRDVHGARTDDQAFLFRVDPLPAGRAMIIVQSAAKPDWEYAFQNAEHFLAAPPQIKPFDPLFQQGQLFNFRLLANPTRKKDKENRPQDKNNYGRRVPVPESEVRSWLVSRSAKYGFQTEGFDNVQTGYVAAFKGKDNRESNGEEENRLRRFFYARYDGRLRVTDCGLLREAVIHGIGAAKGFGFGLLSVAAFKD